MDAKLNITSISQIPSAIVEASTMESNNMTSTSQESSEITPVAMENEDQTATTSLQLSTLSIGTTMSNITPTTSTTATIAPPTPSTSTTMSNITPTTSVAANIPSPLYIGRLPIELRLPIYNSFLCMTVAGLLPPILRAFHGTSEYSLLQYLYRLINFVLSNATLPIFSTITNRGNRLNKILYLHLRSDNFQFYRLEEDLCNLLKRHVCKLRNSFQKITFTAIQPTLIPPHTTRDSEELFEANTNVDLILAQICDIVIGSVQAPEFRLKFLGYNNGNLIDQRRLNRIVEDAFAEVQISGET
ncbi:hypothetical protein BGAL_0078g00020 [Botrytis galanthina]|uniref:Uncharacterized protein n=1 Tax=Botrytis galanthina TaxID=278940 RepID=A0A4S8R3P8_9HELO|nr:hypothetical protein BGAL_0078g00020 [Botrytis galanthina]